MILTTALLVIAQAAIPGAQGTPTTLAALRFIDITQGTGAPAEPGKRFKVHYTGWLKDGTKFDSSVDRKEPFEFVQGRKQVIPGWDVGFEGMKAGGKRRLIIPYEFAYGEKGSGPIPPKAELTFDIELLDVTDAPVLAPAIDQLLPFADVEARVLALAKSTPESVYSSRPAFAQALRIIAALAGAKVRPVEKYEIVEALKTSMAAVHAELDEARGGMLASDAAVLGKPSNKRGQYTQMISAIAEQLGRAETIAASAPGERP